MQYDLWHNVFSKSLSIYTNVTILTIEIILDFTNKLLTF